MEQNKQRWRREELSYCSNVHPGETIEAIISVIAEQLAPIRKSRKLDRMGAGLWLCDDVVRQIIDIPEKKEQFQAALKNNHIDLFTLNGFPFGNFHAERVKENVYIPDWSENRRYKYTTDLAEILADNLPEHIREGSISTLPLGYRHSWNEEKHDLSLKNLCQLALFLEQLYQQTGRVVRVCLEMEPDCVLETTGEMIAFFNTDLLTKASELNIDQQLIYKYLGVCFDVCHQAVMFEQIDQSLRLFLQAGITIGKIQVSSALEISDTNNDDLVEVLQQFVEPRYLHQTCVLNDKGVQKFIDLPEFIMAGRMNNASLARVHFHLPIQMERLEKAGLGTTQKEILTVLDFLVKNRECHPHIEIETYTWHVLPSFFQASGMEMVQQGLIDELDWLSLEMFKRELLI